MKILSKFKIFLLLITLNSVIQPQTDSTYLIEDLASGDYDRIAYALNKITKDSLAEYIPYLEDNIFNQTRERFTEEYLLALNRLGSPDIIDIAIEYIDSVSNFGFFDTLEAQLTAVAVLFNNRDYTRVQYLFDFIARERPCLGRQAGLTLTMLANIIKYDPPDSAMVKAIVINISKNCSDDITGTLAIQLLHHYYGSELVDHYLDRFINDQDDFIRWRSMEYLFKANYPQLNEILHQKLKSESDRTNRIAIGDSLLFVFGQPSDYKAVKEWIAFEQSETAKSLLNMSLEEMQPNPPNSLNNILEYIDFTNSLCDTLLIYYWLSDLQFKNELQLILQSAKTNLQAGDSLACRVQVKTFQDLVDNVYKDSLNSDPRFVTIEGWKFLYWNAQYILDRLREQQANPNLLVNLKNSLGTQIPASNVTYYESAASGWKDAVNNGDGTFTVITTKPTLSIRMFYEYANQTVHNVPAQNNTYAFTTVNTAVELRNSSGNLIPAPSGDQGTVQYYAGAWRSFGTTTNGVAYKELLPVNYSFRMTYEYVPVDKQQDISTNSTVTFTTVLCTVQVTNANNQPLADASTKYYSLAWRDIGLTNSEGIITKELLPKNLSFRATYNNVSLDKQQDIGVNNLVEILLNVP